jgi:hypothetical protein
VSKQGSKFATTDIKDYYLSTPIAVKQGQSTMEFMHIKLEHIPQDDFEHHGHAVHTEISTIIYGSPPSRPQNSGPPLVKHLKASDYIQYANTFSLFRHKTRDISLFTLVVDDFGIMYTSPLNSHSTTTKP